jgi:hypothetical protein
VGKKPFPFGERLPKNCGKIALNFRLTSHTGPMQTETLRWIGIAVAMVAAAVVWVLVIVAALQVSTVVLNTLKMIVELAAMTP